MLESLFMCEIRSVRGVPGVIPEGTDFMLRVRFAKEVLPKGFRRIVGRIAIRVSAEEVVEVDAPQTIYPQSGAPEIIVGVVLERDEEGVLLVDAGVPFEVVPPSTAKRFKLGNSVRCLLLDDAEARDVHLQY